MQTVLNLNAEQIATMAVSKTSAIKGLSQANKVVNIPIDSVAIREDWNVRYDYGNIQELADSLRSQGQQVPIHVDSIDYEGKIVYIVTSGHRRIKALGLANEQGAEIETVQAIVNSTDMTETDKLLQTYATNSSKRLSPIEKGELFMRLAQEGHTNKVISEMLGVSDQHIRDHIKMIVGTSMEERAAVKEGRITGTALINAMKKEKDKEERARMLGLAEEEAGTEAGQQNGEAAEPKEGTRTKVISGVKIQNKLRPIITECSEWLIETESPEVEDKLNKLVRKLNKIFDLLN